MVRKCSVIQSGDSVLLALSGGFGSSLLLHLLSELRTTLFTDWPGVPKV
jgi:tRNA(Ile)-lysidine synthase TilS/MesJ